MRLAEVGHYAASLHRHRGKSLIHQARLDNNTTIGFGLLENLVDLFRRWMHTENYIRAELFIQQRRTGLHGLLNVDGSWQRLVIDLDQIPCITTRITTLRDYNSDWITIKTNFTPGQRAMDAHPLVHLSQSNANRNTPHRT